MVNAICIGTVAFRDVEEDYVAHRGSFQKASVRFQSCGFQTASIPRRLCEAAVSIGRQRRLAR